MDTDERRAFSQRANKVCPDPAAYKRCRNFKFSASRHTSTTAGASASHSMCDISDLSALNGHFSEEELASLLEKGKAILMNERIRRGFRVNEYLVDSGGALPYRVRCWKSGKCSCSCSSFSRNNLCDHCVAVAIHLDCIPKVTAAYKDRNLSAISTTTAPKNVRGKAPSRKRPLDAFSPGSTVNDTTQPQFHAEVLNHMTVVIWKQQRPADPPSSSPFVLKNLAGNIKKCAGCLKGIKSDIASYHYKED